MSQSAEKMTLVWWMPSEFWQDSLSNDPSLTPEQTAEFLSVLEAYLLIAVVDGKLGPFGGITFASEESIRKNIFVVDRHQKKHVPLNRSDVSDDAENLIGMMKPVLANALGKMGENLFFCFFPSKMDSGEKIADATSQGLFSVFVGEEGFKWRFPLGSVLPPKVCPVDSQKLNGSWNFCPWHGAELSTEH